MFGGVGGAPLSLLPPREVLISCPHCRPHLPLYLFNLFRWSPPDAFADCRCDARTLTFPFLGFCRDRTILRFFIGFRSCGGAFDPISSIFLKFSRLLVNRRDYSDHLSRLLFSLDFVCHPPSHFVPFNVTLFFIEGYLRLSGADLSSPVSCPSDRSSPAPLLLLLPPSFRSASYQLMLGVPQRNFYLDKSYRGNGLSPISVFSPRASSPSPLSFSSSLFPLSNQF